MANQKSEYQESYSGQTCRPKPPRGEGVVLCTKSLEQQPVGGAMTAKKAELINAHRLPICDEDFVTRVYSNENRGIHHVEAPWKDPRWSDAMRDENCMMYDPAQRDPTNKGSWYNYSSTLVDPLRIPSEPLTVPDVHKLRYMNNNYMTQDDWY